MSGFAIHVSLKSQKFPIQDFKMSQSVESKVGTCDKRFLSGKSRSVHLFQDAYHKVHSDFFDPPYMLFNLALFHADIPYHDGRTILCRTSVQKVKTMRVPCYRCDGSVATTRR